VPALFPEHENVEWQFGTIEKAASIEAVHRKLRLRWTWVYDGGSITKSYVCSFPMKLDIEVAAAEAGLKSECIAEPPGDAGAADGSCMYLLKRDGGA
jgi:hypothetical protein